MKHSQLTTIVTLFSGRKWMLQRWFRAIRNVEWEKKNLHIVAVDNSRNAGFEGALRAELWACGITHSYIADDRRIVDSIPASVLADSAKHRMQNNYTMNIHLARLYALASQYVPTAAANVWCVEDDVEVPADALTRLSTTAFRWRSGAVSGCLRTRFNQDRGGLIAWKDGARLKAAPRSPMEIEATGCYCLFARRDAWDAIAWRPGATGTDKHPYYDWAMCHDMRAAGHRIYLDGSVKCRHWQKSGPIDV